MRTAAAHQRCLDARTPQRATTARWPPSRTVRASTRDAWTRAPLTTTPRPRWPANVSALSPAASTQPLSTSMRAPTLQMETVPTPGALTACDLTTTQPPRSTTVFVTRYFLVAPTRWPTTLHPCTTKTMARAALQAAQPQTHSPPLTSRAFAAALALPAAAESSAARTTAGIRLQTTTGPAPQVARSASITRRVAPTPGRPTIWRLRTWIMKAAPSPSMAALTLLQSTLTRPPPCFRAASLFIPAAPTAPRQVMSRQPIQMMAAVCITFTAAPMLVHSTLTPLRP